MVGHIMKWAFLPYGQYLYFVQQLGKTEVGNVLDTTSVLTNVYSIGFPREELSKFL